MKSLRGMAIVVPLMLTAVILAGCSTATTPRTTASAGDARATGVPAPTSTTTPTVSPAAAPGPRVQLACADLYSTTDASKIIESPVTETTDESTKPEFLPEIANAQLGVLTCDWSGPNGTEVSSAQNIHIAIAPDSADAYAAHAAADLKPASGGTTFTSVAGDQSGYWCRSYGLNGAYCYAQMLVGNYWASIHVSALDPDAGINVSLSTISTRTESVLSKIAGELATAHAPVPEWVPPAAALPSFCTDSGSTAVVRSAFGLAGYTLVPASAPYVDANTIASQERSASCTWTDKAGTAGSLDVEFLAGGSWVYPSFHTTPYADGMVQKFSPVTITGATSADLGCADSSCGSSFAVGTTFMHVDFSDRGAAKNLSALAKLAAAIESSTP